MYSTYSISLCSGCIRFAIDFQPPPTILLNYISLLLDVFFCNEFVFTPPQAIFSENQVNFFGKSQQQIIWHAWCNEPQIYNKHIFNTWVWQPSKHRHYFFLGEGGGLIVQNCWLPAAAAKKQALGPSYRGMNEVSQAAHRHNNNCIHISLHFQHTGTRLFRCSSELKNLKLIDVRLGMQIKNRTDDFSVYIHKIYCIYCTEQKGKLKYLSDKIHWALIPEKSRCKKSQIFLQTYLQTIFY